jgi:hypothetical protein
MTQQPITAPTVYDTIADVNCATADACKLKANIVVNNITLNGVTGLANYTWFSDATGVTLDGIVNWRPTGVSTGYFGMQRPVALPYPILGVFYRPEDFPEYVEGGADNTAAIQAAANAAIAAKKTLYLDRSYNFTTVNLIDPKSPFAIDGGGTLNGTLHIYRDLTGAGATYFNDANVWIRNIHFDFGRPAIGGTVNAIVLEGIGGLHFKGVTFRGCNRCFYVPPADTAQNVARITIEDCPSLSARKELYTQAELDTGYYETYSPPDYYFHAIHPTSAVLFVAELTISGTNNRVSRDGIYATGIDGYNGTNNIWSFPAAWNGGSYNSQIKGTAVTIVNSSYVKISHESVFGPGTDGYAFTEISSLNINNIHFAEPGQRDGVNGNGIHLKGAAAFGLNNINISCITWKYPSGFGIKIGPNYSNGTIVGCSGFNVGSPEFYYGDGTGYGVTAVPALIPPAYHISIDPTCRNFSVDQVEVNGDCYLPRAACQIGDGVVVGGVTYNGRVKGLSSITDMTIDASEYRVFEVSVGGYSNINTITGLNDGDKVTIFNTSGNTFDLRSGGNILLPQDRWVLSSKASVTLQKTSSGIIIIATTGMQGTPASATVTTGSTIYLGVSGQLLVCSPSAPGNLTISYAIGNGFKSTIINNGSATITVSVNSGTINGLASVTISAGASKTFVDDAAGSILAY